MVVTCTCRKEKIMAKSVKNTERVSIFLPPDILQSLKDEAEQKGTNVSSLIRMILIDRKNNK